MTFFVGGQILSISCPSSRFHGFAAARANLDDADNKEKYIFFATCFFISFIPIDTIAVPGTKDCIVPSSHSSKMLVVSNKL